MTFKIQISDEAIKDLDEAVDWYDSKKLGLGFDFYSEVEDALSKIEQNPTYCPFLAEDYRQLILKTFPYKIVFKIILSDVVVFAIFHTSRNDEELIKRL